MLAHKSYVGAPPVVGTGLIILVSFVPLVAFAPMLANGLSVGMLAGYTIYMCVHYACHFWAATPSGYLHRVRLHHAIHHYRDDAGNFGVTTSFWDRVFRTRIERSTEEPAEALNSAEPGKHRQRMLRLVGELFGVLA